MEQNSLERMLTQIDPHGLPQGFVAYEQSRNYYALIAAFKDHILLLSNALIFSHADSLANALSRMYKVKYVVKQQDRRVRR
jgi:hypothetical protein